MTNETKLTISASVIGIIGVFTCSLAFKALWGWFIVPLGVQPITLPHAFGVMLIWDLVMHRKLASIYVRIKQNEDRETLDLATSVATSIVLPGVVTGLGYIAQSLM